MLITDIQGLWLHPAAQAGWIDNFEWRPCQGSSSAEKAGGQEGSLHGLLNLDKEFKKPDNLKTNMKTVETQRQSLCSVGIWFGKL